MWNIERKEVRGVTDAVWPNFGLAGIHVLGVAKGPLESKVSEHVTGFKPETDP